MIPAEAVEAAAKVWQARDRNEGFGEYELREYTEDVTAMLEAAAPYMRPYIHYVAPTDSMWDEHQRTVDPACTCDYEKIQNGLWKTIAIRRGTDPECAVHK